MRYATTTLAFCVAGLLALGIVMLYSAGMAQTDARYLTKQLQWGGIGIFVCFCAAANSSGVGVRANAAKYSSVIISLSDFPVAACFCSRLFAFSSRP